MSKIAIIGSGVVGKATGMGLLQMGNQVVFQDIDSDRIDDLSRQGLNATSDLERTINQSDISFVCVPTPYNNGIDLSYVKNVVKGIADVLKDKKEWHLVVIKSTVIPNTTENELLPILLKELNEFGLCMNPEFLTEISATWTDDSRFQRDFWAKDRIVIGELDKKSGDALEELYKPLGVPILRTDLKTAEMTKYATNCMLATKISYWNEIYLICERLGIDSQVVADITALDTRIGKYGTIHGKAFGGSCLPKDLDAFADSSPGAFLLSAVKAVNDYMSNEYGRRE